MVSEISLGEDILDMEMLGVLSLYTKEDECSEMDYSDITFIDSGMEISWELLDELESFDFGPDPEPEPKVKSEVLGSEGGVSQVDSITADISSEDNDILVETVLSDSDSENIVLSDSESSNT